MSMINKQNKIAIYHNLPPGGGMRMIDNIVLRYKDLYDIDLFVIGEKEPLRVRGANTQFTKVSPWNGFLPRMIWIYFVLPIIHKNVACQIAQNYKVILITHDYFTKSPYLLRYLNLKNIYLCQESQREFYEPWNIHAPSIKEKIANFFRLPIKYIDRTNVSHAKIIICNSKFSKKTLQDIYNKKCNVIYPGVNEKDFKPANTKKENMILCVGGINPIKDQLFLVNSLKPILNKYKLILVGEGKKKYIDKVIRASGNSHNLKIIDKISDSKLINLYRKSLVTCITAYNEPFGLSSIESQACGTPVVAVNEGGPTETITNNKTGLLVKRDPILFRKGVLEAIHKSRKLGKLSHANVMKKWTWNTTLKKLDKYLKS